MADIIMNPPVSPLAPQMPTTPTKEALAMNFQLDPEAFDNSGSGTKITTDEGIQLKENNNNATKETIVEKKEDKVNEKVAETKETNETVVPVKEDKKTEPATIKSVLKAPKKDGEKKEEVVDTGEKPKIEPVTLPAKKEDSFDYSKYAPHEVVNLKNMSRQSREFAVKLMEENKKLSSQKDSLYLQHEQGYLLSPEYKELSNKRNMLAIEGNAWKDALIKIKKGEPFKEPIGYNPDGTLSFSAERPPSDEDELKISQIFNNTSNQYNNVSSQLQVLPKQYGDRVNADLIIIKDLQKQLFSWHQDPELMNHSVEVSGQGDRTLNQIKQEFVSQWPSYMVSHPAVQIAADLMISLRIRDAELREARATANVATIKQKEVSRGEPSSNNLPAATTSTARRGVPSVFSIEEMPS